MNEEKRIINNAIALFEEIVANEEKESLYAWYLSSKEEIKQVIDELKGLEKFVDLSNVFAVEWNPASRNNCDHVWDYDGGYCIKCGQWITVEEI